MGVNNCRWDKAIGINTVQLRLKLFVKVNFFYVDAKRLAPGYHRDAEDTERIKKWLTELYCNRHKGFSLVHFYLHSLILLCQLTYV
ncbi:hypothetical protein A6V25_33050 [Nostoc sp. ATCC 53789]|nr:hypothetical protein A6V25_33050 [Nostoc sp. ATCC 53789]